MEIVNNHWNSDIEGHNMFKVVSKLKLLTKPLRKLLQVQGNLHERVNLLIIELDNVQKALDSSPDDPILREEEGVYVQAFNEAKLDEEHFLKQKAKGSMVPEVFVKHYEQFLGSDMECANLNVEGLFSKTIPSHIAGNMVQNVTNKEIKDAMFDIGDEKSPGPNGFTSLFFKKGWDIIGDDICNAVRDFFSNGIKEVVSDNQSAFITGRRISDNILITQELMHNYHRKIGPPRCAFKIDIQKAYDTVDWRFLETILIRFGFHRTMVKWIMACVTSTFHRHCEEIQLINVCFADDLFIFARGEAQSAQVIMDALEGFKLASGLVPSLPKSTAYFCNVLLHVKNAILSIMPFAEGELPVKYLGVPLISSRLLNRDCKILVEQATNRIGDWKNKSLSFARRLQLCKSVISSMHVYWASVLMTPQGIIDDIHQLIRGFLWCNGEFIRGKAKVSWEVICLPKCEGGLSLRNLHIFNFAFMTTHIWNIVSSKDSLWVR
ncbi:putative RNA-directed DNA polymerase, eukaryota, reverse transcriptase zinc-binding domain protein [Tanacetum coccineum]